jgi:hypothetical protein
MRGAYLIGLTPRKRMKDGFWINFQGYDSWETLRPKRFIEDTRRSLEVRQGSIGIFG